MVNQARINEIKKHLSNLLELERVAANKTLKQAQKTHDDDIVMVSQSYIMALQRIQELINNLFKTLRT